MNTPSTARVRRAIRQDAEIATKLYEVQEKQIKQLELELHHANVIIFALSHGNYDLVDPVTGEVTHVFPRS